MRSALYNYLFARKLGGQFLLRIEDTDQTREVPGAVENLIAAFQWLELEFDEGPHIGGPVGPYIQSERLALYREQIEILALKNLAYPCFCSPERLDQMRASQTERSAPPMYDRRCRALSKSERAERVNSGEAHVWRMAVPQRRVIRVSDLVRGDVDFATETVDDQVLLKSDGFPTYHLANVIDDHFMNISHVIRGEEWLPSAPKHLLLYEFFGWEPPRFAHLPLLLNPDRSKMSKRGGDVAVEDYRRKGFRRDALINFVALLGWHPQDERELFSVAELIHEFSIERVNKAGAIFDVPKLRWMNGEYVKRDSDAQLFDHVKDMLTDEITSEGEARVRYAVQSLRAGTELYTELAERVRALYAGRSETDPELSALLALESTELFADTFRQKLAEIPLTTWQQFAELEAAFKSVANVSGLAANFKGKALWQTIRALLTGQPHGPELGKLVGIWGRDRVLSEIDAAIALRRNPAKV